MNCKATKALIAKLCVDYFQSYMFPKAPSAIYISYEYYLSPTYQVSLKFPLNFSRNFFPKISLLFVPVARRFV